MNLRCSVLIGICLNDGEVIDKDISDVGLYAEEVTSLSHWLFLIISACILTRK